MSAVSLTTRVNLFVAIAIVVCLAILHAVIVQSISRHFAEQDAEQLGAAVDTARRVFMHYDDELAALPAALASVAPAQHGLVLEIHDDKGRRVYSNADPGRKQFPASLVPVDRITPASLNTWRIDDHTLRGAAVRVQGRRQELVIAAAIDMAFHNDFMTRFRRTLWGIMALAGIVALSCAWLAVRQGLAPLRELSRKIRAIHTARLQTRLDPAVVPTELEEMVQSVNHMIGQLEEGFTRLSHFAADIAHELRTPLTNLITQTQVALGNQRSAAEYRELLYSNLEELERLATMVSDMLWLARTDRGLITPAADSLRLGDEVRSLFDYFGALAEERQVALELDGHDTYIQADRAMIRRAIANLLSNAIRHTPPGGTIHVRISPDNGGGAMLSVENPGAAIPPEQVARVFERFYRVDPARWRHSEGAGLGLAIVKSIVELHGGEIRATSQEGKTSFSISLPGRVDAGQVSPRAGVTAAMALHLGSR